MKSSAQFDQVQLWWDDFRWCGNLDSPILGVIDFSDVEFCVNSQDEEPVKPCTEQVATWRRFVETGDQMNVTIFEAAFAYYNRMRPQYLKAGAEWNAKMPEIKGPNELISMIRLSEITVTWPYDGALVRIGIQYECDWDREHGPGIVIEGEAVVDCGSADCAIL